MSGRATAGTGSPGPAPVAVHVLRGRPDDAELAALVAAVLAARRPAPATAAPRARPVSWGGPPGFVAPTSWVGPG
ncbi:hypothetical protein FVA95_01750 [Pseudonocardia sp. EV170527-09]|uniref:acyl-CoA carboxylase epsilon subunit n=1 Tax=Pseudonocardia sp. EV170527-09 TaxID=2603411 RepID=UPI0011F3FBCD|nr:acyl-CoA carboxylase epsilon subunit [Pseudonocardia sp. EV170527-09]KAA1035763.1 hypothetical protein FVA95_01750 [Pseudonocardia sp. EV170527-09]